MSNDRLMRENLEALNSISREPSITIRMRPMVPNAGSRGARSGIGIPKKPVSCLTAQPKTSRRMTEGMRVSRELMSNMYANNSKEHNVMIIGVVIVWWSIGMAIEK